MTRLNSHFTLKAAKAYELVFFTLRGQRDEDAAAYFGSAENAAREAGMVPIAALDVTELEHSDIEPIAAAIFEWPSARAIEDFRSEKTWNEATHQHRALFSSLNWATFSVQNDTEVAFENGGLYEFALFWMNRHHAGLMDEYFQAMGPLVKAAAPRPLVPIGPLNVGDLHSLAPDRINFLQWTGGRDARDAIFASEEFKAAGWRRALALDRMMTIMVAPA